MNSVKVLEHRGFKEIHGDGDGLVHADNTEYAVFAYMGPGIHPFVYRNPKDRQTWCLSCAELGISDLNLCQAVTSASWKSAIDIAIVTIEQEAKLRYTGAVELSCHGLSGDKHVKFQDITGADGSEAPTFTFAVDGIDATIFQNPAEIGANYFWYLTSKSIGLTNRRLCIGNSNDAKKVAISTMQSMISRVFKTVYSLEE